MNRSSVPATTSGLGERRRLPARFPADVGPDNGPLCPAWAGCQGARPWPGALAPASMRARGPENPADKEARPLPETITAKEIRAQSRCARPPGPHNAGVSEAGRQPAMPASRRRVPTLQPGACTVLLLKPTLRGSAEPGAPLLTAPMSLSQRSSAGSDNPRPVSGRSPPDCHSLSPARKTVTPGGSIGPALELFLLLRPHAWWETTWSGQHCQELHFTRENRGSERGLGSPKGPQHAAVTRSWTPNVSTDLQRKMGAKDGSLALPAPTV